MPVVEPSVGNPPVIGDAQYIVICRSVEAKDITGDQFGNNQKLEFGLEFEGLTNGEVWEDADEPNEPFIFKTRINRKWNEKSTFFLWAKAFGIDADDNQPFDSDALLDRKARATVETEAPGKWPKIVRMSRIQAQGSAKPSGRTPAADTPPWDEAEAGALNEWLDAMRSIGFTTKEIIDFAKEKFEKLPKDLTPDERDKLSKELGV